LGASEQQESDRVTPSTARASKCGLEVADCIHPGKMLVPLTLHRLTK